MKTICKGDGSDNEGGGRACTVVILCGIEMCGVCRWIGKKMLFHLDILKFEIGLLEAEKIKLQESEKLTLPKHLYNIVKVGR